jgi:hypothetical protein
MFDVPPLPLFEVSLGAKLTDVKRPPTPLFHLFQIASVAVSNALWKWPVRTESERLWQLTDAYISKAKAPRKTVVRKTAFLRNRPLGRCQRVIRIFSLRWKYLKRPDAICGESLSAKRLWRSKKTMETYATSHVSARTIRPGTAPLRIRVASRGNRVVFNWGA